MVRILQLDQAIGVTGFAIVESVVGTPPPHGNVIEYGRITLDATKNTTDRLLDFRRDLSALVRKFNPDILCCEKVQHFSQKRPAAYQTALGLIDEIKHAALIYNKEFKQLHPATIKKEVANHGNASKYDMIRAARRWWGITVYDHNVADALCGAVLSLNQWGEVA